MTLNVVLSAVSWQAGRLRIEGHAYIRRLDAPRQEDTRIEVMLRNTTLHRTIPLKVRRVLAPEATARSGQAAACYDWSGFQVEINPALLSNLRTWRAASWELRVKVSGHGVQRDGPVSSVRPGSAMLPAGRWVADGVWLQPAPEHDGRFLIRATRPAALVTGCQADDQSLQVEGWSAIPLGDKAAVVIGRRQAKGTSARFAVTAADAGPGRYGFRATVPAAQLLAAAAPPAGPPPGQPARHQPEPAGGPGSGQPARRRRSPLGLQPRSWLREPAAAGRGSFRHRCPAHRGRAGDHQLPDALWRLLGRTASAPPDRPADRLDR